MTTQTSPSVLELVACETLKSGLREGLRYLLSQLNQIEGFRKALPLGIDEIVLSLDLLIEYNHLRTHNSAYAENLYGLVRTHARDGSEIKTHIPSLVCLTLIPYIRRKLDKYFDELHYKERRTANDVQRIRIYRLLTRSCSFINLVYLVRYAAGKSNHHNPLDAILDISLKHSDHLLSAQENQDLSVIDKVSKVLANFTGRTLTVGSYFIQFLDYWNTRSNSAPLFNAGAGTTRVPDPPVKDDLPWSDERSSSLCLICLHVRQNECVLSNTGYVFCYSCLHRYVKTKEECPITHLPATTDNIVKLFKSDPF